MHAARTASWCRAASGPAREANERSELVDATRRRRTRVRRPALYVLENECLIVLSVG